MHARHSLPSPTPPPPPPLRPFGLQQSKLSPPLLSVCFTGEPVRTECVLTPSLPPETEGSTVVESTIVVVYYLPLWLYPFKHLNKGGHPPSRPFYIALRSISIIHTVYSSTRIPCTIYKYRQERGPHSAQRVRAEFVCTKYLRKTVHTLSLQPLTHTVVTQNTIKLHVVVTYWHDSTQRRVNRQGARCHMSLVEVAWSDSALVGVSEIDPWFVVG